MGVKEDALDDLYRLMKDFDISRSRLSLDIMDDPSFITRLEKEETKITNVTLDKIKRHVLKLTGQLDLDLDLEKE
jgi:hypothetical protein